MLSIGNCAETLVEKFSNSIGLPFRNLLTEEDIQSAVQATGVSWRERIYSPSVTVWAMISQVLDSDRACRKVSAQIVAHLVSMGKQACSDDPSAFCQARKRLPADVLPLLARQVGNRTEEDTSEMSKWFGRSVRIVDGSSFSMPDTPENQKEFPQPSEQASGCGFPSAKIVAIFSWLTGAVIDASIGSLHVAERTLFHRIWGCLKSGEILLNDRGFCSYADIACLLARGVDSVMRVVQRKRVDFRRGKRLGKGDHLVIWLKPISRPEWLSQDEFNAIPDEILLREVQLDTHIPGFRSKKICVVTTLLDSTVYPKSALLDLFLQRWDVEIYLRHLKISLKMDILTGHSPEIVRKEFWAHLLAYNLIRGLMGIVATTEGILIRRLSMKGTLERLSATIPMLGQADPDIQNKLLAHMMLRIAHDVLPHRPGRVEPRVRKRRPKSYPLLTVPRHVARRRLVG